MGGPYQQDGKETERPPPLTSFQSICALMSILALRSARRLAALSSSAAWLSCCCWRRPRPGFGSGGGRKFGSSRRRSSFPPSTRRSRVSFTIVSMISCSAFCSPQPHTMHRQPVSGDDMPKNTPSSLFKSGFAHILHRRPSRVLEGLDDPTCLQLGVLHLLGNWRRVALVVLEVHLEVRLPPPRPHAGRARTGTNGTNPSYHFLTAVM